MALYRLEVKILGRSAGHSAIAAAAYRSGNKIFDERNEKTHDYTRKTGVKNSLILAPAGSPDWVFDRERLWNEVEKSEKRKDAQLAREVIVALPRELNETARLKLLNDFVSNEFVAKGMIADVSYHNPKAGDGGENPHAHIMLTMRDITLEGFQKKNRSWNTAVFTKDDYIRDKSQLVGLRATWADYVNNALASSGNSSTVSHLSNTAQGNQAPLHIPFTSHHIDKKGSYSPIYFARIRQKQADYITPFLAIVQNPKTANAMKTTLANYHHWQENEATKTLHHSPNRFYER